MSNRSERIILASFIIVALASSLAAGALRPAAARAETVTSFEWTRQWSAGEYQRVCLAADSGAIYVASEAHLRKYDAGGALLWHRSLDGAGEEDYLHQVTSISAGGGAVYLAGSVWCNPETTSGDFCGGFVCRYNANGDRAWALYPETEIYATGGWGVFADASGVYLAGNSWSWETETGGGFLRKYNGSGGSLWQRDLGMGTIDTCWGVCGDAGEIYVSGSAPHEAFGAEAHSRFLCRYGGDGAWRWTREYSWDADSTASPVCAASDGVCVAGGLSGTFRKYDAQGGEAWTREIGAGARVLALEIHGGDLYVAGSVSGALVGQAGQGGDDAFAARYDTDGNRVWARQFGSGADDAATAVVVPAGAAVGGGGPGVCLAGITGGALPGAQGTGHGFAALLLANTYPDRPVNASPAGGEAGVSVTPALQASAYADADGDNHAASRWQVRSAAGGYDSPAWDSGSSGPATSITVPDGVLAHSASYYWRVGYRDGRGLWSSYSQETAFTTAEAVSAASPAVETLAAEGVGPGEATLKLSLTGLGSAASAQVSFEWGPSADYGSSTAPQAMTAIGAASFNLSGLAPAATYHFRAKAEGDGTAYGGDLSFTTLSAEAMPPAVGGLAADSGRRGDELTVNITGANFTGASDVDFGSGIIVEEYTVVSDSQMTARIVIGHEAESGERTVTVTTPWGTASVPGGFSVKDPALRVHLWVYLAGAAAGVVVLGALTAALGLLIMRRPARPG